MCIVTLVALLLAFGESVLGLVGFGCFMVWLLSDVLATCLPTRLKKEIGDNCVRANGTWSPRRQQIEFRAIDKLRWALRLILFLVAVPTLAMVWLVDREVAPLSVGMDSAIEWVKNPHASRADFADQENRFDQWKDKSALAAGAENHKRLLWHYWPLGVLIAVMWFTFCWVLIQKSYLDQLKKLAEGIKKRRWEYLLHDRASSSEWSDESSSSARV